MPHRKLIAGAAALLLLGTAARAQHARLGSFALSAGSGPYIAGSSVQLGAPNVNVPVSYSLLGPGTLRANIFFAPDVSAPTATTVVAAIPGALAVRALQIVPPPPPQRALIAIATYQNGVALHDPKTFKLLGYAPAGGPPGDVAFDAKGNIFAPDTDGTALAAFMRSPWSARRIEGVATGNEVAADALSGAIFVSDRDLNGKGALTRIARDGSVTHVVTGDTAEGLAIDARRSLVYVGNVNDSSVAEVDARSMKVLRKIRSVPRTFGIALDARKRRLFVVSNNSPGMRRGGGYVAAIDLARRNAPIVARSANLTFPLGAALDAASQRLFVTDEAADIVYVLSARTLRAVHAPLRTCRTPWRPLVQSGRLYVPCARADRFDVFDLRSLRRVAGAPFSTGGFPMGVAVWP